MLNTLQGLVPRALVGRLEKQLAVHIQCTAPAAADFAMMHHTGMHHTGLHTQAEERHAGEDHYKVAVHMVAAHKVVAVEDRAAGIAGGRAAVVVGASKQEGLAGVETRKEGADHTLHMPCGVVEPADYTEDALSKTCISATW